MALNIIATWQALFDSPPTSAQLVSFESEDASSGDAATIASIIATDAVQQEVIPVIQIIQLATGLAPNASQLANWVAAANSEGLLAVAQAWVNNSNFQVQYGTTSTSIIEGIYAKAFDLVPSTADIAAWSVDSPAQILLAFATSTIYTNTLAPYVTKYLTDVMDAVSGAPGAVFPSGGLTSLPVTTINQTLELTVGQDLAVSGQAFNGTGATVLTGGVEINAPLGGVFGNQATLTAADDISLSGAGNILNATFDGTALATGVTLQGLQSWNIQNVDLFGGTTVFITGTAGSISGLTSLAYNDNEFGNSLVVGLPTAGIVTTANGFNLTVENAMGGGGHAVTLFFASSSFAGGDAINVTANVVGNTLGGTFTSFGHAYGIVAGSGGSAGFATWNVTSTGANTAGTVNDIALGALGSTAARTLNITDDSSPTIIWAAGDAADWAQLTNINASGTSGTLTITGHEFGPDGLLADNTAALTSVIGGSGADTFDLSAFGGATGGSVAGLSLLGGGNAGTAVEFNNTEINTISGVTSNAFAVWNGVAILDDVGVGGASAVGGTFNMADFPGTLTVSLLTSTSGLDPNQTSAITVKNAPDGLTFDFNNTDQNTNNFSVTGSDTAGGADNVVTVNYDGAVDSKGMFTSQNFDFVNINVGGTGSSAEAFYTTGVLAIANAEAPETLAINAIETHGAIPITLDVGDISGGSLGTDTITLLGGVVTGLPFHPTWTDTGTLDITGTDNVTIGVTNASTVASSTSGAFDMASPDDVINPGTVANWIAAGGVVVTSASEGSTLQGSLGAGLSEVGSDTLMDTVGGSTFYGDGGADTINIGGGSNDIVFGEYLLNNSQVRQVVEAGGNADLGFWNAGSNGQQISGASGAVFGTNPTGGTSADMTTINGFTLGTGGDNLTFNVDAWNGGSHFGGGLDNANSVATISATSAAGHVFNVGFAGEGISTSADLVVDSITDYADANALAHALATVTVGDFNLGTAIPTNTIVDILVAYATGTEVRIADVELVNLSGTNTETDTANSNVTVHTTDLVSLPNVSLTGLSLHAGEIQFAHL